MVQHHCLRNIIVVVKYQTNNDHVFQVNFVVEHTSHTNHHHVLLSFKLSSSQTRYAPTYGTTMIAHNNNVKSMRLTKRNCQQTRDEHHHACHHHQYHHHRTSVTIISLNHVTSLSTMENKFKALSLTSTLLSFISFIPPFSSQSQQLTCSTVATPNKFQPSHSLAYSQLN